MLFRDLRAISASGPVAAVDSQQRRESAHQI